MDLTVEFEREEDVRWLAEITTLPGVMVYGGTREEAAARVQALALRVIADRWSTARRPRRCSALLSSLNKPMAFHESQAGPGRPAADGLERQAPIRIASHTLPPALVKRRLRLPRQ